MFQSTPPHGGRLLYAYVLKRAHPFQSTPPHGGRQKRARRIATFVRFQSTPPHGGRHHFLRYANTSGLFQSTPPHGGRPWNNTCSWLGLTFQSTPPHGGRRGFMVVFFVRWKVSIHAPAWRATKSTERYELRTKCFNPRPRMEGDNVRPHISALFVKFQSTPPHGGRLVSAGIYINNRLFQSTPPHGGRHV